jgi:hypothetical protein
MQPSLLLTRLASSYQLPPSFSPASDKKEKEKNACPDGDVLLKNK